MRLEIKDFFEAQHQLPDTEFLVTKACNNYHGHTYFVKVSFKGDELKGGMIVDFKGIKQIIAQLDHTAIYEAGNPMIIAIKQLKPEQEVIVLNDPPSSENISKFIYESILKKYNVQNLSVSLCEGYKGEEKACWTTYEER